MSGRVVVSVPLAGGLRLDVPPSQAPAGALRYCENFEVDPAGGYAQSLGYERFNGLLSPALAPTASEEAKRRAAIEPPKGVGPALGVFLFQDRAITARLQVDGTVSVFRSTSFGWDEIRKGIKPNSQGAPLRLAAGGFTASAAGQRLFVVNSGGKALMYDGRRWTEITTGMPQDKPTHAVVFRQHVFFAYPGGSLQFSGIGDPTSWTPITGAGEIGIADEITNLAAFRDALIVFGRRTIHTLTGSSSADFVLQPYSQDIGAEPDTVAELMGDLLFCHGNAVLALSTADDFGKFATNQISKPVAPLLVGVKPVAAYACRDRGQYRLILNNRTALTLTHQGGWSRQVYSGQWLAAYSGLDSSGNEWALMAGDSGHAYRLEQGCTADGAAIQSGIKTCWADLGKPQMRKRWHKLTGVFDAVPPVGMKAQIDFDFGASEDRPAAITSPESQAFWDGVQWDEFYWDADPGIPQMDAYLSGVGVNASVSFLMAERPAKPYRITAIDFHISARGIAR